MSFPTVPADKCILTLKPGVEVIVWRTSTVPLGWARVGEMKSEGCLASGTLEVLGRKGSQIPRKNVDVSVGFSNNQRLDKNLNRNQVFGSGSLFQAS